MTQRFLRDDGQFAPIVTSASSVVTTLVTKATTADIGILIGSYVDGPSVAQGTSGVWYAFGSLTLLSTPGNANYNFKLYDGTSIYVSGVTATVNTGSFVQVSLQAVAVNPAGNLRLAAGGVGAVGTIKFNASGLSNDSYITAIRIG